MNVRFSGDSRADLETIEAYIRRDNPDRALTFIRELALSAIAIGTTPEAYPALASAAGWGLRRKVHGNYLIVYRLRGGEVEIVRILHGARDIAQILGEKA
jgi:plasmid stabilization system protein ParE